MLNADQVNLLLESLFTAFETRVPALAPLSVGKPAPVTTTGAYGSVILGALFKGDIEGKLTLTLEWETAFLVAEVVLNARSEGFNADAQKAVETVFLEAVSLMQDRLTALGHQVQISPLPLVMDMDVLLNEENHPGAIRLPLSHANDQFNLYLAFHEPRVAGVEAA